MPFDGNSHKEKEAPKPKKTERKLKPVADGSIIKKKPNLIERWLSRDGETIKEFLIETIILPGIIDGISGIGDIIIDGFTEGVNRIFEKKFEMSAKSKGRNTSYSSISKKRRRRSRDADDDDDYESDGLSYDNVHVKSERQAEKVINELRAMIADDEYGYATVANLYELTNNEDMVTITDHEHGWTKLDSATWTKTRNRENPWLLILPQPKKITNLK